MKRFLIFCSSMLLIGLMWVALPHLDDRDSEYEERLVGAVKFLEGAIEISQGFGSDVYAPSIEPGSSPNHWVLSGIVVTRKSVGARGRAPFSATLERTCLDYGDPTCWRLAGFAVAGRAVNILVRETENGPSTPGSHSGGATKESSEFDEAVVLPSPEAASAAPVAALLPAQEDVMPSAVEANQTPSLEILVAGVDVEASVLRADGESALAFEKNLAWLAQRVLKKLKYDPGPLDGKLGSRTMSAIRSYQRDHDLTADGRPSRELLHHMKDELRRMAQQRG